MTALPKYIRTGGSVISLYKKCFFQWRPDSKDGFVWEEVPAACKGIGHVCIIDEGLAEPSIYILAFIVDPHWNPMICYSESTRNDLAVTEISWPDSTDNTWWTATYRQDRLEEGSKKKLLNGPPRIPNSMVSLTIDDTDQLYDFSPLDQEAE